MSNYLKDFNQEEYSRVLNEHGGPNLSNYECIDILMAHGASYDQAKSAAYTYLHHGEHLVVQQRGSQELYNELLDEFDCASKRPMECIRYLESCGFTYGQARSAVHKYRKTKGLIKPR